MTSIVKLEFGVEMTCQGCADAIEKALRGIEGVKSVNIDVSKNQVVVETFLSSARIHQLIESTGRRAVLLGAGSDQDQGHCEATSPVAAAVSIVTGSQGQRGVVRFVAVSDQVCLVDGTIDGLEPGHRHTISVHELGDISNGCESCGDVFRNDADDSAAVAEVEKSSVTDSAGRGEFRYEDSSLRLWDVIGRSVVIHDVDNDNQRIACGIIARSSGLFQNPKRICVCSGATLWQERETALLNS